MKLIIIVMMMVAATLILVLCNTCNIVNSNPKKGQQPVKQPGENRDSSYILHRIHLRLNLF